MWLKDRLVYHGINGLVNTEKFEVRHPPALLHDIFIFGKSLISHRLNLPRGYDFGQWLFAYEEGLKAALAGRDPIVAIAEASKLSEKRLRLMLSGFRAHPVDDMAHIARTMAIAAHRNFFGQKTDKHENVVYVHGKPAMGVEGVILSTYGNSVPLRDSVNMLHRPVENHSKKLTPLWVDVYNKYAIDEDSTRVLDVLFFSADKGYTTIDRLVDGVMSKKSYYKPKISKHLAIHPKLLLDMEKIIIESEKPIVTLFELLVPHAMGSLYFSRNIGNKNTQIGSIREATKQRIRAWIEVQRHELEKRERGPLQ